MEILLLLFITFFEIGLFSVGGGYAIIPLVQENVLAHGWMTLEEMLDMIAISGSVPGIFAVKIAAFVGMEQAGLPGAVFAALGMILPSFVIILFIARFFNDFKDNFFVQGSLRGLRAAAVGLLAYSLYAIVRANIFDFTSKEILEFIDLKAIALLIIIGLIRYKFKRLHSGLIVVISAALGIVAYYLIP